MLNPYLRNGELCSASLRVEYLLKLFGILLHGNLPFLPYLLLFLNHLFISLYICGYLFYFGAIMQNYFVAQIFPLGASSVDSCASFTYSHDCGCFQHKIRHFLFSLSQAFLAKKILRGGDQKTCFLQNPGSSHC